MTHAQDLEDKIAVAVERFYDVAGQDPTIGPFFAGAVHDWPAHLAVVRDFWSKILLGTERYQGDPFKAHEGMKLEPVFFTRWLEIFAQVAGEILPPEAAAKAMAQAQHMSQCLQGGRCEGAPRRITLPLVRAPRS